MPRKNKYSVTFVTEKRRDKKGNLITDNVPINMVVTWSQKRLLFYTGYRIDVSKWDTVTQRVCKGSTNRNRDSFSTINARLVKLQSVIDELFFSTDRVPAPAELKDMLRAAIDEKVTTRLNDDFYNCFDNYINCASFSDYRKRDMQSVMARLKEFRSNLKFDDCDSEFIKAFANYLKTEKDNPRSLNTIHSILKRLRAFFYYAIAAKLTDKNPFVNTDVFNEFDEKYGVPIYLTKDERDKLYFAEIGNERLARVRDMFVLQCLIGCRVGDLVRLKHSNIINGFIKYAPSKTDGVLCSVPLTDKARAIISRYDMPDGSLLPYITDQRYNEYIKELFVLVGLTRPVARRNPHTREVEVVPLNVVASSHMARRTFVGLLHKTVKNEVIGSMSGHVQGSRAFARYYAIDAEDQINAIKTIE